MSLNIKTKEYVAPEIYVKEVFRYMGTKETTDMLLDIVDECLIECASLLKYKLCYYITDYSIKENSIDFGFAVTHSQALAKHLANYSKCIIFAATIGTGIDRLITKYSRISPVKALCFQAIGTERIEALCDTFEKDIAKEFDTISHRFSPGYADFELSFQNDLFRFLGCSGKIGLTLNSSLIMSPSKSVTGVIGIK